MRVVNLYCLTWKRRVDGEDEEKGYACTCAFVYIDAHRVPVWWFDGLHSQQHNFYNRWQMPPSLVIKAKARMNPTMRKKHLELQSGWTTRRLPAMRQNSIQGNFPLSEGGSNIIWVCWQLLESCEGSHLPVSMAEQREDVTHTLEP